MILCIGTTPTVQRTLLFANLRLNEVNRSSEVYEYASGKSVNVARVARTLGKEVLVTGFVGGDRGRFLCQDLEREGIGARFVDVAPQTRLCTTIIDGATGGVTELVEESRQVEAAGWEQLRRLIAEVLPTADVAVCSGSLPPKGPSDFYAEVVRARGNAEVIVDARGAVARSAVGVGGFILKLNREELGATVDRTIESDADLKEAMKSAMPGGGAIVVTMGKDGVAAMDANKSWRLRMPAIKALNPIGSGDSFAAGMAVALADRKSLMDAVKLGAACGAANALTVRAGEVRVEDVQRISGMLREEVI
jgi:tagatose 6-phosphate kinase